MENKIAVVTVYNACNYGSFLQAYAMQAFLKSHNYSPYFVKMNVDYDKIIGKGIFSEAYSEYEKKKYDKLLKNQEVFKITESVDKDFECSIIGSDTVWNMFDQNYASIPYFVGKQLSSKKVISYAASIGPCRLSKLMLLHLNKLLPIRKLDAISVRDDRTEQFVKLLCKKPVRVLDPTFLTEFEPKKPDFEIPNRYMLVYTYGFDSEKIDSIKKYAEENNLKIVATGSLCDWADINAVADSFEWLWLIQNAECVVTNTFHGTVFSIIFQKRFADLAKQGAKIESLLAEFGLEDKLCGPQSLSSVLNRETDYSAVNQILKNKVNKSKDFILNCLR